MSFVSTMNPWRAGVLAALALLAAGLSGCDKKPGGQVIAVVNNEEITQQELKTEAEASNLPAGTDSPVATAALLQRVVDRNLLADYARDQGLDRQPEYVARRRQMEQTLLANLGLRKLAGPASPPTTAEVQGFIAANPTLFGKRERLALDQIRFVTPQDKNQIQALTKLGTIDAIALKLTADGIQFARGKPVMDTGTVDPAIAKQIAVLPNGEVFDLSANGTTFISTITARTAAAAAPATWTAPATEAVRRNKLAMSLEAAVERLRKSAKITYDPAFTPPAKGGAKPTPPAAPAAAPDPTKPTTR